jgi:hypothetical protein
MRLPILVTVVFVVLGFYAGAARADYTVSLCQNGGHLPLVNEGNKYSAVEYRCEGPPVVDLDGEPYQGTSGYEGRLGVGWYRMTATAPAGIAITSINTTLRSEALKSGSSVYVEVGDDAGAIYRSPEISRQSSTTYEVNRTLPPNDTTVWLGEFCSPDQNVGCFFANRQEVLAVEGLSLTVHDNEVPSLSLTGGRLTLPGTQAGMEDVMFSAAAQDSGIAEVDAYLGTTLVGTDAYQSTQCSYTQFDPCPRNTSDNLQVNTRLVPDGTYPLILEASDASGNAVSVTAKGLITVANDTLTAGAARGAGAPNGHSATTKAQITDLNGQNGKIKAREGQPVSVVGRLTDQTGTPIPGATLDVLTQTAGSTAPFAVIGHASTDANGGFTFRVPPGPSRVIRIGYRAFANDTGYDATADLAESVTAATSLSVTPKRLRGRSFTFRGRVNAGNFPSHQQVDIQALIGSSWIHVAFARVAANGQFKVRYRLKHLYSHVTFVFRAVPVASAIWPYEPQPSNNAQLRLR